MGTKMYLMNESEKTRYNYHHHDHMVGNGRERRARAQEMACEVLWKNQTGFYEMSHHHWKMNATYYRIEDVFLICCECGIEKKKESSHGIVGLFDASTSCGEQR